MVARPAFLVVLLAACGGEGADSTDAVATAFALPAGYQRLADPQFAPVREALEHGEGARALALLERVQGFEAAILRARALFLTGDRKSVV